jgi:ribosome maturation factor RimP
MRRHAALENLIAPIVGSLGLTWVGLQYFPQGKRSVLRLFVDKPGGLSVEDCGRVSRQVNTVLSVENPITGEYTLEVSSPGLDRLLFSVEQCHEQIGKSVFIQLVVPKAGTRNFKGKLERVEGSLISILTESGEVTFSFDDMSEMRLVPAWSV